MADFSEVVWRKTRQSANNGNCVELAPVVEGVAVRDSKDPGGSKLTFTRHDFRRFVGRMQANEFDL
jgi:hypothetical protein